LIWILILSELKQKYRRAVFGFLWWILEPFLFMAIYYVLIHIVLHRGEPAYPLFLFCAILPWRWFASATSQSVTCVSGASRMIQQLAFPRVVYPISTISANAIYFLCGLLVLLGFMFFYGLRPSFALLFFPLVVAIQYLLTLGFALLLAGLGVFFTDLQMSWSLGLRAWFYLSPALYPLERVPEAYRAWFMLNPFAILFESYRSIVLQATAPNLGGLAAVALFALLLTAFALFLFTRLEPYFAKVV
jgi:ABC-type polysaccharide/polyol phosphate export permease